MMYAITFDNLLFEKQQELINFLKKKLINKYLKEGEEILKDEKRKWFVNPKTKEEAYCRTYAVGSNNWADLDENSQEFKDFDWTYELTEYAEKEADKEIRTHFKYFIIKI